MLYTKKKKKKAQIPPLNLHVTNNLVFDMNAEHQFNRHQCRTVWTLATRLLTMNQNKLTKLEFKFLKSLAATIPNSNLTSPDSVKELLKSFIDPEDKATLYKDLVFAYAIAGKRDENRLDFLAEVRRSMDFPYVCYNQICISIADKLDHLDLSIKGLSRDAQVKILALASKMVYADEEAAKPEVITFRQIIDELEEDSSAMESIADLAGEDVVRIIENCGHHEIIVAFSTAVRIAVADRRMDAREMRILNELNRLIKLDDWHMHLMFLYLDLLSNASLSPRQGQKLERTEIPIGLKKSQENQTTEDDVFAMMRSMSS